MRVSLFDGKFFIVFRYEMMTVLEFYFFGDDGFDGFPLGILVGINRN